MSRRPDSAVLLVRHAVAEDEHALGDDARPLTVEGRDAFRAHAERVARKVALHGVVTSPLVRAVQTAEILAHAAGLGRVLVRPELDPARGDARAVATLARELGPGWALVGHNPSLAEALAQMLALEVPAVRFRKGAVAALAPGKTAGSAWALLWTVAPGGKTKERLKPAL